MKTPAVPAVILALVFTGPGAAGALDLKVWTVPVTDRSDEPIDQESVRVDATVHPGVGAAEEWVAQVRRENPGLAYDVSVRPVVSIAVTLIDPEEAADSSRPFIAEARRWAARYGANALYLDRQLAREDRFAGMRFIGYRIEYKHRLVSPTYLAALPFVRVTADLLEEQLQAYDVAHFGQVHVAFEPMNDPMGNAAGFLAGVKNGTAVKLFLRDGTDLKGDYSGQDDDNHIWIHTPGWAGLFRDHAIPTQDIQAIALLN
jgi:hypothetical protein